MDRTTTLPYPARAFADAAHRHGVSVPIPRSWRTAPGDETTRVEPTHEVTDLGCIRPTTFTSLNRWRGDIASIPDLPEHAMAQPGRTLLTLDVPLLPLWVLASRSGDTALGMVLNADDPWDELALCLFGDGEDADPARAAEMRSIAKAALYSWTTGKPVRPKDPELADEAAAAARSMTSMFRRAERWLTSGPARWERWKTAEAVAYGIHAEILGETHAALTGHEGTATPVLIVNSLPVIETDVEAADWFGAEIVAAAGRALTAAMHVSGRASYGPRVSATAGPTLAEQRPLTAEAPSPAH